MEGIKCQFYKLYMQYNIKEYDHEKLTYILHDGSSEVRACTWLCLHGFVYIAFILLWK